MIAGGTGGIRSRKEGTMNWERVEDKWKMIQGNVAGQWDGLSGDQLASRVRETVGTLDEESECELPDWRQRLSEIQRAT